MTQQLLCVGDREVFFAVSPWTQAEIDDFITWHERRIAECGYSPAIAEELRRSREKWLSRMP
jgi:hypothetical protein